MKKTFGMIALLAASSLALVSPALARDRQDNNGYRNQNYSNSFNQRSNSYARSNNYAPVNTYVARDVLTRDNDRRDRDSFRDSQWQRRDIAVRDWR